MIEGALRRWFERANQARPQALRIAKKCESAPIRIRSGFQIRARSSGLCGGPAAGDESVQVDVGLSRLIKELDLPPMLA
ncbi:hypothetical protein L1887_51477 [Cichorium endivia]|nr:hypothetical protein L1887_51477 [Cichorium endivia]